MKIFIGSTNSIHRQEATRWLQNDRVLRELEASCRPNEIAWGECSMFLEVGFPQFDTQSKNKQIDLVVSFNERVVMCELKRGSLQRMDVERVVNQVHGQEITFDGLLRSGGFAVPFGTILFCPALRVPELMSLRNLVAGVHEQQHVHIAGSSAELRTFHIVSVLEETLSRLTIPPAIGEMRIQQFIESVLTQGGRKLEQYANAVDTLSALRSFVRAPHVILPPHHVEDAREGERDLALAKLRHIHIVELCGPPEIGKSVLAQELIRELGITYYDVSLDRSKESETFESIGRLLEERIEGVTDQAFPGPNVAARLVHEEGVFWIRSYNENYRAGLADLLERVRSIKGINARAYWIVESRRPLAGRPEVQVELGAMDRATLARLLLLQSQAENSGDIESAIDRSLGRPGAAIRALKENDFAEQSPREFGWFDARLKPPEKRILACMCFAMARSPLGLSRTLIDSLVGAMHNDLPSSDRRGAIDRVLNTMRDEQLADVTAFTRLRFGGLLDEIVPAQAEFIFVNRVEPSLIAAVTKQLDPERTKRLANALEAVMVDAGTSGATGNLAEVTYEICVSRNLEPFFRSAFRFTSLGSVLHWIDSVGWEPPDARQAYLLKVLRILQALRRDSPAVDIQTELNTLDEGDPIQRFARDYAIARGMTVWEMPGDFDCAVWRKKIDVLTDPDLRVAFYISCSTALQQAGRAKEAWELLRDVLPEFALTTSAGTLLQYEVGTFMNRKKGRAIVRENSQGAVAWIASSSNALVASGLHFENIQLISAGLFYYARAAEFSLARTDFSAVLRYVSALDWIENVPGSLSRWRMRILLTRGSIHRHYLRDGNLTWREFEIHLKLAWADYTRAFLSSSGPIQSQQAVHRSAGAVGSLSALHAP